MRSKNVPRDLCRKAKRAGGNQKEIGASRSISNQVYVGVVFDGFSLVFQAFFDLGGLKVAKTFQDAPRRAKNATRRAKMRPRRPQDAPRRPQDVPKTPQDAPRGAQEPPKTHQNPFKIHTYVENVENQKNIEKPMKNQ